MMSIEKRFDEFKILTEHQRRGEDTCDQLRIRRELWLVERSSDSHGGERKRNGKAVKISFNERQRRGIDNK